LVKLRGLSLHNVITITRINIPHALGELCLHHTRLISLGNMQALEYLIYAVGDKVLLVMQPYIWLGGVIINWDLDAHNLALGVLVVQSQTIGLFLVVFHNVVEKLVLDV